MEEGVAGEGHVLRLAVVDGAALGVSWGLDDAEGLAVAERDGVAVVEAFADDGEVVDDESHGGGHLLGSLILLGVAFAEGGEESPRVVDEFAAHGVVEVAVGEQVDDGGELLGGDVFLYGRLLEGVVCSAVDDDALVAVVADDVAVLGQRVALYGLYL